MRKTTFSFRESTVMAKVHPNVLLALSAGIQSEVAAYVFYLEASKKVDDDELRGLLEKLALEEKGHFFLLERRHHEYVRSEKWISTADILKKDGLPEVSEEMASEHQDLIEAVRASSTKGEVLDIAYKLEEDSHVLFSREAERSEDAESKKVFQDLARIEKGHMDVVKEMKAKYA